MQFGSSLADRITARARLDEEHLKSSSAAAAGGTVTNSRPQTLLLSKLLNHTSETMQYAQRIFGPGASNVSFHTWRDVIAFWERMVECESDFRRYKDSSQNQHQEKCLTALHPPPVVALILSLHKSCSHEVIKLLRRYSHESRLNEYTSGNSFELQESGDDLLACNATNEVALCASAAKATCAGWRCARALRQQHCKHRAMPKVKGE